jgi:hypothetical protein
MTSAMSRLNSVRASTEFSTLEYVLRNAMISLLKSWKELKARREPR